MGEGWSTMAVAVAVHPAVEDRTISDRRECRICGRLIIGWGADMRHLGEPYRPTLPDPGYGESFTDAAAVIEAALTQLAGTDATEAQIARAAAQAVHERGLLRQRRRRKTPVHS
jgi:hypothetical protein